jgi:tetratricopeptide (TPR) repeat protein
VVKKLVATAIVIAGLAAAGFLADQAIERNNDYDRFIDQGDAALGRGETFVAIEQYSGAIALKSDSMLAYLRRGEAHQRRGDTPEMLAASLRDLRKAAELEPASTRTLEKLGDVNFQLHRYGNAAESYEGYIRLDDHSPEIFYKLALASRADGRLARATSALQQAIKLNPNFHEAHYVLGLCLRDRGQLAEARAAFDRAITISPAFIPAREEIADLYRLQDDNREEIAQLEALFALDPAKAERLIAVGLAHLRAGNRDLAVVTLRRAAELFPETPNVYAALGQVWLEAAEDWGDPTDLSKALEAFERVSAQTNATSETLGHYGRALILAGQHARAETVLRQASQRFPTDPEVLPHFAAVAERLGHLDDARQALVRYSILVDEDREEASHALRIGDLSMQLNDAVSAVAWYQKSESLGARDATVFVRLAEAQARAGHLDQARASVERALQQDPQNAAARGLAVRLQPR